MSDAQKPIVIKAAPMTEKELARQQLKESIDRLSDGVDLRLQMQAEPLKLLGGASVVGTVLGLAIGSQIRRTKRIYVDAASPIKHQKGLIKAQQAQQGKAGGALLATLGTLAVKLLTDKVLGPKLEGVAHGLMEKAASAGAQGSVRPASRPASSAPKGSPATKGTTKPPASLGNPNLPSSRSGASTVKALAEGSEIDENELQNPNARRLNLD